MKTVHPDMCVKDVLDFFPMVSPIFQECGLGRLAEPEIRDSLGALLQVRTAARQAGLNPEAFITALNRFLAASAPEGRSFSEDYAAQRGLSVLGLLPCGMKMAFSGAFDTFMAGYAGRGGGAVRSLIEGNVNHEISYYAYIDTLEDAAELPDIIVSSDINAFFHHAFVHRFVSAGVFASANHGPVHPQFSDIGYTDPDGHITMLSANLLVVVVNEKAAAAYPRPRRWRDFLDPEYENSVVMRGQEGFFCNGVLLPYYRDFGMDGIRLMRRAVRCGMHPAEMVRDIVRNGESAAPFYVMPLFFARRLNQCRHATVRIPEEGAIVSPVTLLVKREKQDELKDIISFITGRELSQSCAMAGFPSVRADVDNGFDGMKLLWMGWDFLRGTDPAFAKQEIDTCFAEKFRPGSGS